MNYMRISHDPVMRMIMKDFMNQERETERKCRWTPATNITENTDSFRIEMAVPGYNKEDFRIDLEKDVLTISGVIEKEENQEAKPEPNYRMREFARRNFCRSFTVNETIEKDSIKAEYNNGILTVVLPRKEEVKMSKEIRVE
ncbi:MAG TPA: Hsp20/alpha crystallin family protein [Bacteroidales bacterium]|nr:Hsp20/alpha crystallin family protein [Bacteroidales bacterium]